MTVYQRILRAHRRGQGCRLTQLDCHTLAQDKRVTERAYYDDLNDQGIPDSEIKKGTFRKIMKPKRGKKHWEQ